MPVEEKKPQQQHKRFDSRNGNGRGAKGNRGEKGKGGKVRDQNGRNGKNRGGKGPNKHKQITKQGRK